MVEIREVKTKKEQKEFLHFPLDMYKDNPNFVPPLYGDEKKIFSPDYTYYENCEAVYYNAYRDGKIVGRISGILQRQSNEKRDEKRIRFTRFDSINDQEVADALFGAVEDWGRSKGMDTICGPLGFSDQEREGLLIEGFDELSTFEEQYNADYYQTLIDNLAYKKEIDWIESKLYLPDEEDTHLAEMADYIFKRYELKYGEAKSTKEFLSKYKDEIFELLDQTYSHLYGTVPMTEGVKKMLLDSFNLVVDMKHTAVILDKNGRVVCFGICFPSLAKAVQKSQGRLTPAALIRVLKAIKKPKVLDLALIGVSPEYYNRGVAMVFMYELMKMMKRDNIEHCETNLNMEDNMSIRNAWKRFKQVEHKRRRAYVKSLTGNTEAQNG